MQKTNVTRRGFIQTSAALSAVTLAAMKTNYAHAAGSDVIKTGVIGCGGRGSGAAQDHVDGAKMAGGKAEIVAVADMFADRWKHLKDKFKVADNRCFTGFDAYKQLLATDVDVVILATPPGFRPIQFAAAVEAGKHVFMEKPTGTDPVHIRMMLDAAAKSEEKKLHVVTGTQRRHEANYIETIKAIHAGDIGDVLHMSVYWNGGGIWWHARQAGWSDMEYELRNWYHYIWLCGDQIVEQHVHNLDVANWVMGGPPTSAYGMGGRQVRDRLGQPGEIWDHFAIEYEYANGGRVLSMCRHWPNATDNVSEYAIGTKGTSNPGGWIQPYGGQRKNFRNTGSGYKLEHRDLVKSLMDGTPINEAKRVAESTMTAILGRMSAYTGQKLSWEQGLNSKLDIMPKTTDINASLPAPHVPQPGVDKFF